MADLSMALACSVRPPCHDAPGLHRDRIKMFDDAVADLDARIAPLAARYAREAELLKTLPGFGDAAAAGWLGQIGPAPHQHFATAAAAGLLGHLSALGNDISAERKARAGGPATAATASSRCWSRPPGRRSGYPAWVQARFHRLVRRVGGARNKGAIKRAIMAIAHTLPKIANQVLKTGTP